MYNHSAVYYVFKTLMSTRISFTNACVITMMNILSYQLYLQNISFETGIIQLTIFSTLIYPRRIWNSDIIQNVSHTNTLCTICTFPNNTSKKCIDIMNVRRLWLNQQHIYYLQNTIHIFCMSLTLGKIFIIRKNATYIDIYLVTS